jgi:hypothetical protein
MPIYASGKIKMFGLIADANGGTVPNIQITVKARGYKFIKSICTFCQGIT